MGVTPLEELKSRAWYKHYPEEIRQQIDSFKFPELPVYWILESSAKYFPNSTAIVYEPENLIPSYHELLVIAEKFASGLQNNFNVKKGDRIAIYARNYPEFVIAVSGIELSGAVYVACNPMLIREELEYQLQDAGAKLIISSDDMVPVLKQVMEGKNTPLEKIIIFERDRELKPALLLSKGREHDHEFVAFSDVFSDKPFIRPNRNYAAVLPF